MVEFKALKLVEFEDLEGAVSIRLKDGFDWFFTPEFKRLKGDFMTGDFKGQARKEERSKAKATRRRTAGNTMVITVEKSYRQPGKKYPPRTTIFFQLSKILQNILQTLQPVI